MCYELFISETEIGHNLFPLIFFFFRIVICWVFYCYGFLVQAVVVSLYRVPVTRVFLLFSFTLIISLLLVSVIGWGMVAGLISLYIS